ncbi:hypothetical protein SUGI_0358800 [Cryptomeria japonica]|nr:hypothetical protein SUGI_0358800 [Cryptomeria japonica]
MLMTAILQELGFLICYIKDTHEPIVSRPEMKITVLVVFSGMVFASIALSNRAQTGLELRVFLPQDSNDTNLLCSISQSELNSLLNEISKAAITPNFSYIESPAASWLDDFLVW